MSEGEYAGHSIYKPFAFVDPEVSIAVGSDVLHSPLNLLQMQKK